MDIKKYVRGSLLGGTISAAALLSTGASAALFDFVALAAGNEHGAPTKTETVDGITLTITAYDFSEPTIGYNPYYDDVNGAGLPAGLGVCKILTAGNQCTPSNDDNLSKGEVLKLEFDQLVTFESFTFRDGNHNPETGDVRLSADGTNFFYWDADDLVDLSGLAPENRRHQTIWIRSRTLLEENESELAKLYLSTLEVTAVPVPAAAWLFGSGLMGLVGLARRHNRNA